MSREFMVGQWLLVDISRSEWYSDDILMRFYDSLVLVVKWSLIR